MHGCIKEGKTHAIISSPKEGVMCSQEEGTWQGEGSVTGLASTHPVQHLHYTHLSPSASSGPVSQDLPVNRYQAWGNQLRRNSLSMELECRANTAEQEFRQLCHFVFQN